MFEALDITEAEALGLGELAELDLAMARSFAARAQAAEDPKVANDLARSYQRMARSYRQSLALKVRLKRELTRQQRESEQAPQPAVQPPPPPPRDEARIANRKDALRLPVRRVIWDEYEEHEDEDLVGYFFDLLEQRLERYSADDAFGLVARDGAWEVEPLDDHVVRLCLAMGLPEDTARSWRHLNDPDDHAPAADDELFRGSG